MLVIAVPQKGLINNSLGDGRDPPLLKLPDFDFKGKKQLCPCRASLQSCVFISAKGSSLELTLPLDQFFPMI